LRAAGINATATLRKREPVDVTLGGNA